MSTRRPKSVLDQDRYTAELSTGQLVIGVCILLMFGLGCFLLGVLIGKFDPTLKTAGVERSADDPREKERTPEIKVSELPAANNPPANTQQATPPPADPVLPPEMRAPANVVREDAVPNSGATVTPTTTSATQTGAAPPANNTPVEVVPQSGATNAATPPATEPAPHSVSESVAAAAERNRIAPPTASPQAVNTAPTNTQPAAAAQQTPAPAESNSLTPWKGFGVQILAVAKDRAEGARKDLEAKSSYKARVLPHSRNDLYRVVVGPYADQTSAAKARDDLRARGFRDAFVLTLQ